MVVWYMEPTSGSNTPTASSAPMPEEEKIRLEVRPCHFSESPARAALTADGPDSDPCSLRWKYHIQSREQPIITTNMPRARSHRTVTVC